MELSYICFGIAFILFCVECNAWKKRKRIDEIRQQVHKPLDNSNVKEAAAMGATAVGLSLFDVYTTMHRHSDILEVLEQRFPNAHGDKSIWEWYSHLSENIVGNSDSIESYVSCFKGQVAENCAVELLREQGLDANLFDSLTNETNDIYVTLDNGNTEFYSVKCGDTDYIRNCIETTDADNYIINSESYAELHDSGLIELYEEQGITIIDGNYSDDQLTYMAEDAFEEIGEAGDVSDTIPYIALACLGWKTIGNIQNYAKGKQSEYETLTNVGVDVVKFSTTKVIAGIGYEVGASVGTMIFPGVGTIIGAGIGAFGGALMSNSVFEWGKERIKWGKIIDAQDYFGDKLKNGICLGFGEKVVDKYMLTEQIDKEIEEENKLCEKYKDELNPYSLKKPSVYAVLADEYYKGLKMSKKRIKHTKKIIKDKIIEVCEQNAKNVKEAKRENYSRRLIGELVVVNADCLRSVNQEEKILINGYQSQKSKAPNYPYKFAESSEKVMEKIVKQTFNSCQLTEPEETDGLFNQCLIVVFCVLGILL